MLTVGEINIIGEVMNTNWGYSSTEPGAYPLGTAPSHSLTGKLVPIQGPPLDLPKDVIARERRPGINGDGSEHYLVINYVDIVSFRSDREAQAEVKTFREVAEKHCASRVAMLKDAFKKSAGRSLRIKLKEGHDSVETFHIPTAETSLIATPRVLPKLYRGYYRYTAVYTIS